MYRDTTENFRKQISRINSQTLFLKSTSGVLPYCELMFFAVFGLFADVIDPVQPMALSLAPDAPNLRPILSRDFVAQLYRATTLQNAAVHVAHCKFVA